MTKAEVLVCDSKSWTRDKTIDMTLDRHDGTKYQTRGYRHTSGATLTCDNYYGSSVLTTDNPRRVRDIEVIYDSDPTFLALCEDSLSHPKHRSY